MKMIVPDVKTLVETRYIASLHPDSYDIRSNSHNKRTPPQPGPLAVRVPQAGGVLHEYQTRYHTAIQQRQNF
jgi:hypothetical protein